MVGQAPQIVRALKKHKGTAGLIISLVSLTVAVIANCTFVIGTVFQQTGLATGIDEHNIAVVQDIAIVGANSGTPVAEKLAELKRLPHIRGAAFGATPLMSSNSINISTKSSLENAIPVRFFKGSQGYQEALGLEVIDGADLSDLAAPDFVSSAVMPALITKSLSQRLFGTTTGVGQLLYAQDHAFRVAGILANLRATLSSNEEDGMSLLAIQRFDKQDMGGLYVIRATDGRATEALAEASRRLHELNPYHAQPYASTFDDAKHEVMARRIALAQILALLVLVLTSITCFTIGSMTTLWVRQRRTQVGIRRALGASKSSILAYFLIENSLVVGIGAGIGLLLAFGLNATAMRYLEMSRLSFMYCFLSMLLIFVLSQISALGPAWKASTEAPAQVIRNQ